MQLDEARRMIRQLAVWAIPRRTRRKIMATDPGLTSGKDTVCSQSCNLTSDR